MAFNCNLQFVGWTSVKESSDKVQIAIKGVKLAHRIMTQKDNCLTPELCRVQEAQRMTLFCRDFNPRKYDESA